jgi:glycerol-3-phosphate acyltransferase PlsY
MQLDWRHLTVLLAYLLGSFPTALVYSRAAHRVDVRSLGDGNMGARNTRHQFGFSAGMLVALVDILKGALAVLMVRGVGLPLGWQAAGAAAVILGHDFPIFARFRGGQGFAATTGVFLAFFPYYTLLGFAVYCTLYLLLHNSDIAAGVGMGLVVLLVWLKQAPLWLLAFMVLALLFIPFKQWLDRPRRVRLGAEEDAPPPARRPSRG